MKMILSILILSFATPCYSEVVVEKIAENKKWVAQKLDSHNAWNTSSCSSSTLGINSVLEIYAEKMPDSTYAEPTIQAIFSKSSLKEEVFSGEATTESGKKWAMTRASTPADPNSYVLIAKLADRAVLIDRLKKDNSMTISLRNAKGKFIVGHKFSLSGSSKTIEAQFASCLLSIDAI